MHSETHNAYEYLITLKREPELGGRLAALQQIVSIVDIAFKAVSELAKERDSGIVDVKKPTSDALPVIFMTASSEAAERISRVPLVASVIKTTESEFTPFIRQPH